jgi:hypothetical protein
MAANNSRGTVGIVRPTQRTNGYEELLQILPSGIELIPLCLDVRRGALDEFQSAIPAYEQKDMAGIDVDFDKVPDLPSDKVYRFIKEAFHNNPKAEAIYMLEPAWRTLDIIEKLETDLCVPVIHAVRVQCWDIQRHLDIHEPVKGFGLIAELPDGVTIGTRRVPDVFDN